MENLVVVTFNVRNEDEAMSIVSDIKTAILKITSVYRIGPLYQPVASIDSIMRADSKFNKDISSVVKRSGWNNGRE